MFVCSFFDRPSTHILLLYVLVRFRRTVSSLCLTVPPKTNCRSGKRLLGCLAWVIVKLNAPSHIVLKSVTRLVQVNLVK